MLLEDKLSKIHNVLKHVILKSSFYIEPKWLWISCWHLKYINSPLGLGFMTLSFSFVAFWKYFTSTTLEIPLGKTASSIYFAYCPTPRYILMNSTLYFPFHKNQTLGKGKPFFFRTISALIHIPYNPFLIHHQRDVCQNHGVMSLPTLKFSTGFPLFLQSNYELPQR